MLPTHFALPRRLSSICDLVDRFSAVRETLGKRFVRGRIWTAYVRVMRHVSARAVWARANDLLNDEILTCKGPVSAPFDADFQMPPSVHFAFDLNHIPSAFGEILA
ncbi:hypothetical protein KBK24_0121475 [Burkholderia sp. K24]|nr:hypothetical protein KBK24_0121475 [Burkholderia sp. K24]